MTERSASRPSTAVRRPHLWGPEQTGGRGISAKLTYWVDLPAGATVRLVFAIAGSSANGAASVATYRRLLDQHQALWQAKRDRYQALVDASDLSIPDQQVQEAYSWTKFNYDWLVRHVPEVGNGLGAGFPEYPWWFGCDNSYALFGLLATGRFDLIRDTLELLAKLSETTNGNGRIIHEASTNGAVYNPGNTQETPHFIKAVWHTFLWTADTAFLARMYPLCKRGLEWLFGEMDADGDLLPSGYGITEVGGLDLECIDSAVYGWEALLAVREMARLFDEPDLSRVCDDRASALRQRIETAFWIEEDGLYGDMVGTKPAVLGRFHDLVEHAERQAGSHAAAALRLLNAKAAARPVGLDQKVPWQFKHWVILTPLEAELTDPARAARVLQRMESTEFTGPWGIYLSGIDRSEMMTISTAVMAVAEATYGRVDQALRYIKYITEALYMRTPGAPSEMSPDRGCFVQAWSGYGVAWPLITQFLGIKPRAYERELLLKPRLPSGWDRFSVKQVQIAQNVLDWSLEGTTYRLASKEAGWAVTLSLLAPQDGRTLPVRVDGRPAHVAAAEDALLVRFVTTGAPQSIDVL